MNERRPRIDALARAFNETATELGVALASKLQAEAPEATERLLRALEAGCHMRLIMAMHLEAPTIVWELVDREQKATVLMTIPAAMPRAH